MVRVAGKCLFEKNDAEVLHSQAINSSETFAYNLHILPSHILLKLLFLLCNYICLFLLCIATLLSLFPLIQWLADLAMFVVNVVSFTSHHNKESAPGVKSYCGLRVNSP